MSKLKQILSYIWDIPIVKTSSEHNQYLEVVWSLGRKMLNTKNANYSFGNGYKVFEFAFKKIEEAIPELGSVLILGFGCGSVEHLLKQKYKISPKITGVEYDRVIIDLYKQYFREEDDNSTVLINADAKQFIAEDTAKYDLIIIDLFDDLETIPFVFAPEFNDDLISHLSDRGILIYNTVGSKKNRPYYTDLGIKLGKHFREVQMPDFQNINKIIIAK